MTEKQDEPQAEVVTGKEVAPIDPSPPAVVPSNPMEMIGVAVARGVSSEELNALMALQERWEAGEARKAFAEAMTDFKADPPSLTKDATVTYGEGTGKTTYDHATLDQVSTTIGAALSEHGLSHRWDVESLDGGAVKVTCVLMHRAGHSERVSMQSGRDKSGGKNDIQALGSTVTYLQRYSLLAATGMSVAGMDVDGFIPMDKINKTELAELNAKLDEAEVDKIALCKHMGVDSLADLMLRDLGRALTAIAAKRRKKGSDNEGS